MVFDDGNRLYRIKSNHSYGIVYSIGRKQHIRKHATKYRLMLIGTIYTLNLTNAMLFAERMRITKRWGYQDTTWDGQSSCWSLRRTTERTISHETTPIRGHTPLYPDSITLNEIPPVTYPETLAILKTRKKKTSNDIHGISALNLCWIKYWGITGTC